MNRSLNYGADGYRAVLGDVDVPPLGHHVDHRGRVFEIFPGGETTFAFHTRVRASLDLLLTERPGDTIVILDAKAKLRIGHTTVALLPKNERLRVVQLEGDWIGVFDRKGGKLLRGWVHVRHVGTTLN